METLTSYQLRQAGSDHAHAVAATPSVDHFCSSLDWTLPAHEAFIPDHPLHLRRSENGFVTLARGFNPRIGRYLQPLEASWCLASPFAAFNVERLVEDFARECRTRLTEWDLLYLSGVPPESQLYRKIVSEFASHHRIGLGHRTTRYVASLAGGMDGYLSRRRPKFRANLRRAERNAREAGLTYDFGFEIASDDADKLYERILAVEERSWKGMSGTGILDGGMNTFYRIMLPRLTRRNGLRLGFIQQDGRDVAFIFGGVFGDTYRGLQLSFDQELEKLSPGNLAQLAMIRALCEEGIAWYDLGSELEYKSRWAEERRETVTLWVWH